MMCEETSVKRLARPFFTVCSAASLLLCVATCVLCVRSFYTTDLLQGVWQFEEADRQHRDVLMLTSRAGVIRISKARQTMNERRGFYDTDPSGWYRNQLPQDYPIQPRDTTLGFGWFSFRGGGSIATVSR